jgi:hypothetical protein
LTLPFAVWCRLSQAGQLMRSQHKGWYQTIPLRAAVASLQVKQPFPVLSYCRIMFLTFARCLLLCGLLQAGQLMRWQHKGWCIRPSPQQQQQQQQLQEQQQGRQAAAAAVVVYGWCAQHEGAAWRRSRCPLIC